MTYVFAPAFVTVDEAFFTLPANIEFIWIIKKTENAEQQRRELSLFVDQKLVSHP